MARAARWADGVTGFSVGGVADEMAGTFRLAEQAWSDAGRQDPPRKVSGCFYLLAPDDERAAAGLREFTARYLAVFGREFAEAMAAETLVHSPSALAELLDQAEGAGADEIVLVPATTDLDCLHRTSEVVAAR
jgi:alkanesulfonate monooxygenase SsuD/methylene tetrahydromethanopterin reductase-like flavin-dependent oxidoreductase (luciferase family)